MRKISVILLILAAILLSLVSCDEKKEIIIDIDNLAADFDAIYEGTDIELVEVEGEAVDTHLGLKGLYSTIRVKCSVTITSDEYVIMECADEVSAEKAYDILDNYRDERIKLFASYAAEQVPKLEDALLVRKGKYVVFVVANNVDMASNFLKGYIG